MTQNVCCVFQSLSSHVPLDMCITCNWAVLHKSIRTVWAVGLNWGPAATGLSFKLLEVPILAFWAGYGGVELDCDSRSA